jgi:hypothetical protein
MLESRPSEWRNVVEKVFKVLILFICIIFAGANSVAAGDLNLSDRASLQAAMQQYIDNRMIDGAYLDFELDTGAIRHLYPIKAHPLILKMDSHFVLCSSFRDEQGEHVNIDFYVARGERAFIVFYSAIDDRDRLMSLMEQGKVSRIN